MPQILQKMMDETHPNIEIEQITFPGVSLDSHINYMIDPNKENSRYEKQPSDTTSTEKMILQKNWDVIVLQEGTVRLLIPEARDSLTIPAIKKIKKLATNKQCRFILFHTWNSNRNDFPKEYCYPSSIITGIIDDTKFCSEIINNPAEEAVLIDHSYSSAAEATQIEKSNNGTIAYDFVKTHPNINIYEDDQHPSKEGAFLNACIFYKMLTDENPSKLKFNGDLNTEYATTIKNFIH